MTKLKSLVAGIAAAGFIAASAFASDFGPAPDNYESLATDYVTSRLADARGARVSFTSEPYKVFARIGGYDGLPGWAVDIKVRSRMPNGDRGGAVPYTVIFIDGEAVALNEDPVKLTRL